MIFEYTSISPMVKVVHVLHQWYIFLEQQDFPNQTLHAARNMFIHHNCNRRRGRGDVMMEEHHLLVSIAERMDIDANARYHHHEYEM